VGNFREHIWGTPVSLDTADLGVEIKDLYWTLGAHDLVGVLEAPDDESMTAAMLRLSSVGNVRTTTMRAFSRGEFEGVAGRAG